MIRRQSITHIRYDPIALVQRVTLSQACHHNPLRWHEGLVFTNMNAHTEQKAQRSKIFSDHYLQHTIATVSREQGRPVAAWNIDTGGA